MYYMGFTYSECYRLPVWQRQWFIERLNTEIKRSNDKGANQSRALHDNTTDQRQLMGRGRDQVPAKLRRFT